MSKENTGTAAALNDKERELQKKTNKKKAVRMQAEKDCGFLNYRLVL